MKGITLPKYNIDEISFFGGHYDRHELLEVYGAAEGNYERIVTPVWLKKLFEQAYETGKRARSREIFRLLKDGEGPLA